MRVFSAHCWVNPTCAESQSTRNLQEKRWSRPIKLLNRTALCNDVGVSLPYTILSDYLIRNHRGIWPLEHRRNWLRGIAGWDSSNSTISWSRHRFQRFGPQLFTRTNHVNSFCKVAFPFQSLWEWNTGPSGNSGEKVVISSNYTLCHSPIHLGLKSTGDDHQLRSQIRWKLIFILNYIYA